MEVTEYGMHNQALARDLGELQAPEWMRSLRYLIVYPAYDAARMLEEESYAARIRSLGYQVHSVGIPCPDGWWDFPKLDRAWTNRSPELMPHYEELARLLAESDVVIAAGGSMVHPGLIEQFPAYSIFLCADDPENSDRLSRPVAAHFDHCFPLNIACLEDYATWGAQRVDWIFHGLRPEYTDSGLTKQDILDGERDLDVTMFCERVHGLSNREDRLAVLQQAFPQAILRGKGWPGGYVSDREIRQTYRRTKIGWNFHHSKGPCNSRMYMLPAFGVLQICDNGNNLGRILELDEEVVGFDTVNECIEKTSWFLSHDDERRELAARGFERVTRDFTEERQWTYLLSRIESGVLEKQAINDKITCQPDTRITPSQSDDSQPRILILADRPNWAYDIEARSIARELGADHEIQIRYVVDRPDFDQEEFDLLWVCFWGETWHQQFDIDPRRIIKQVSSHRWRLDESWGCLDPATFVHRHLADAGTICAISQELVEVLSLHRPCHRIRQGVDIDRFHPGSIKRGPLRIGFAGNAQDDSKGLEEILLPACGKDFDLLVAGGERSPGSMPDFYQDIDVLCIASTAEGGPLPLLESMACACFPIGTDVGIMSELVIHGDNGLILERDPAAIRAALQWCSHNLDFVRKRAASNAEIIARDHTWNRVAPGWKHVIDEAWKSMTQDDCVNRTAHTDPIVLAPVPSQTPIQDSLKADYAKHLIRINPSATSEETYQAARYYYESEIGHILPQNRDSRCLELGCGFGHLLRWLHESGYEDCTGIEIDGQIHDQAQRYLTGTSAKVVRANAMDYLRDCTTTYDVIIAFDFIEHFTLEEALEILTCAHSRLMEGGQILLRTPNMANLFGMYSRYMDLTHKLGFTEQSLSQLLEQAGFSAVELALPDWPKGQELSHRLEQSRAFHEQIFDLQDRSRPSCFDKNLVLAATRQVPEMTQS